MRYTSSARLLGLPLLEVSVGGRTGARGIARAWVAVGDVAVGCLFAAGGVAAGGIAVGGLAIGILPLGGLALGLLAIGGGAVGIYAIGGAAIAWQAALGGFAFAAEFAVGGAAFARHANDPEALAFFSNMPFSAIRGVLMHARWLILLALLPLLFLRRGRTAE